MVDTGSIYALPEAIILKIKMNTLLGRAIYIRILPKLVASALLYVHLFYQQNYQNVCTSDNTFTLGRSQKSTTLNNPFGLTVIQKMKDDYLHGRLDISSVQISPAIFWIAKTRDLLTFIFVVKMVIISYLFAWINVSFCKEYDLQPRYQYLSIQTNHTIKPALESLTDLYK